MAWDVKRRTYCPVCVEAGKHGRFIQWSKAIEAGHVYCSLACARIGTGLEHPPQITKRGYVLVWHDGQYVPEHKLVAGVLGTSFDVHHKDKNRLNNSPDNLEVLTNAEHIRKYH